MTTMLEATAPRRFSSMSTCPTMRADVQAFHIAIRDAFSHSHYPELRGLALDYNGEAITISGRVPTYYLKQLVQSIAQAAPGVERVNNEVRVG